MFIDIFRGLGTSLVEGCAGDFQQNAAECNRVHPSVLRRVSGACQSASGRAMADRWPLARDRLVLKTNFGDRSAKFGNRSPGYAVDCRNSYFDAFFGVFSVVSKII